MTRTHDERLRLAEAAVVKAAVRRHETFEIVVYGWNAKRWRAYDRASVAESRAVKALLKLREGGRK